MKPVKPVAVLPVFVALLAIAPLSHAGFTGRIGLDSGGDKLLSIQFTNGDTSSIKAGSGIFIEAGYSLSTPSMNNSAASTEITIGYKNDSENASNGDVDFTRLSLNLNQMVTLEKFRLGAGLNYHFNNKLKTRGSFLGSNNIKFDKSLGFSLMAEYIVSDIAAIGLRANFIDYSANGEDIDGNSLGLYLSANY